MHSAGARPGRLRIDLRHGNRQNGRRTITVTDVSKGTSVSAKSNGSGLYRVQHLIPDIYSVEADATGYSKTLVNNVVVYADTAPEVNLQLEVGAVSSTVTVTGGAPLLETDRAEVSTILDARAIENLPNMNRNFTEFELLTPGTTYIGWGPGEGGGNPQRSGSIEVDGQLPFATGYELDGTDNQEPLNGVAVINPNLDSVSEMKMTAQNYDAEFGKAVAGLWFATFLLGDVTQYWRSVASSTTGKTTQKRFFTYAQDQWRATPKLSIDYGLRWEPYTPEAVTSKGEGGMLNIDTGTLNIAGYGIYNNQINVANNYKEFAPRLGVNYQIFKKTVIRAGYGIVYGQGWAGNTFGSVLTGSFPLQIQQNLVLASTSYGAVFNLTQAQGAVPAGPPTYIFPSIPSKGEYVLPDGISQSTRPQQLRLPTVAGWNFTLQQELSPTLSLQIGYIGSEAYHNMFDSSNQFNANEGTLAGFNQINPNTGTTYTLCEREPFCGDAGGTAQSLFHLWGISHGWSQGIGDNFNEATGSYNALQVVLTKRISAGLSFLAHYTWSHALDHESYEFMIDSKIGRGNSYYNRRNAFVFAGDYDLPFGRGKEFASNVPGWANQIIGGFQLNGTATLEDSLPFSPCYGEIAEDNDIAANDGCGPFWPSKVPGAGPNIHKGKFDPIALTVPYLPTSPHPLTPYGITGSTFGAYARPQAGTWGTGGVTPSGAQASSTSMHRWPRTSPYTRTSKYRSSFRDSTSSTT
jgi:hypothetical protein